VRVRVGDGGACSATWRQTTADVLGVPLEHVAQNPGSALGAAFAAGMAVGAFRDWREIERFVTVAGVTAPNARHAARYQELFELYLDLYAILKDTFPRLHRASAM
jgi:xylulokinase